MGIIGNGDSPEIVIGVICLKAPHQPQKEKKSETAHRMLLQYGYQDSIFERKIEEKVQMGFYKTSYEAFI